MTKQTKWIIAGLGVLLAGGALFAAPRFLVPGTPPLPGAGAKRATDFDLVAIDGEPLPMKQFAGQVVLLVNTASFCGYTPQYDGLQKLQTNYAPKGFTVIGVPSGNFLGQEYGSNKEISGFCKTKFGIKFPLAEKGNVVGAKALPIYRWAAAMLGPDKAPKWNFHKYLIGRDGRLITAFGSKIAPDDPTVRSAIEAALRASPAQA
jgi:glutathione peroxidase